MVHVPTVSIVTMPLETVQLPDVADEKLTDRLEFEVAEMGKGVALYARSLIGTKLMA